MVVYGYLRVSTNKQDEMTNRSSILEYANVNNLGSVSFMSETVSGRKQWQKRKLGIELFPKLQKGDIIIMSEYSRIGRDMLNSLDFVAKSREKGVILKSVNGDIPQDDTAMGTLVMSLSAYKAQAERESIAQRTRIGLQHAKEKGVKLGRRSEMVLDKSHDENLKKINQALERGVKKKQICKDLGITYPTLRKFLRKNSI